MKTRFINIIAALLGVSLLFVSCQKEIPADKPMANSDAEYLTFTANLDAASTKTYLDGVQVKWQMTDSIKLWYGTAGTEMTGADYFVGAIDAGDARKATFDGFAKESPDYMAVYPLSASLDCSKKGKLTVMLPPVQKATKGSFAQNANVAVAASNTTDLAFKNIGGLLAVWLESTGGHDIVSMRLAGEIALSGEVEIKKADLPAIDAVTDGTNCVTLFGSAGSDSPEPGEGWVTEGYGTLDGSWYGQSEILGLETGDYYAVALPGSHSSFSITLVDANGCTAVARSTTPFTIERNGNTLIAKITAPTGEWAASPKVFINEIHTHNNQIELWNPNDFSVDLTGWLLVKDEKSWAFPVGSTVPAGGYLVVNCKQSDCSTGPTFGLSGDKGFVLSLVNGTVVDCVDNSDAHAQIGETETYGRKTNGADEWVIFSTGTIFEEGVCDGDNSKGTVKGDEPATVTIVLNEINGNDKYVELYNKGAETVDMTGWTLHKDDSKVWTASDESQLSLAPGAYMVINFVKKSKDPKEAASGLSAGKTVKVELKDKSGASVDVFTRGEESTGWGDIDLPEHEEWSFNRVPNGTGAWKYAIPTKGAENGPATGTIEQYPAANGGVVLNELNGNDKFIELYNTSTDYPISLEDMTLYKDDGTEAIWTGAPGYAVAPGGYVLLYSEDVIDKYPGHDSGLVFTSGLSPKKTLKIELRDAAGTSLDIFTRGEKGEGWGAKIPECTDSYGRTPDGTGSWKLVDKTPGSANGDSKGDIPQN